MKYKDLYSRALTVGIFATLLVPFVVTESMLFPFITGKAFVFRILVEVLFAVWLGGLFWFKDFRPRFSWIQVSVLAFLGVIFIANIFGVSFGKSFWSNFERMEGFVALLHVAAYFLVASSVLHSSLAWRRFFNASVVASVAMAIYAFFQLGGFITINQGGVRVDGTFGNATYLAVYMLFNIFISLFLLVWTYQNRTTVKMPSLRFALYSTAVLFQMIVLYYTATRGTILGLLGGLLLTALIVVVTERQHVFLRKISAGVLVCIIVISCGFLAIRKTDFVINSPTLSRFASLSIEQISTQGRRYVWPMAMQGFAERPVLGWGQENFNYVFNSHYDPMMYAQEQWFDRAHNVVLDWLVAGGVLGFLAYMSLFVSLLLLVLRNKNLSKTERGVVVGLIAAYFFHNLFVFDNLVSYMYFFSLLAFVHSETVAGRSEVRWMNHLFENKKLAPFFSFGVPIALLVALLLTVYSWNVKPILASRNIIHGLSLVQPGPGFNPQAGLEFFKKAYTYNTFANNEATEQLFNQAQGFLNEAVPTQIRINYAQFTSENFDKLIAGAHARDARTLLFAGTFRAQVGDFQNAISYLDKAQQLSPRKQAIFLEKGLVYMGLGQHDKSLENFKTALDLAPENSDAAILYAIAAINAGNNTLANSILANVHPDIVSRDERLIATLAASNRVSDAISLIEHRITIEPNNPQLRFRLAAGLLSQGLRAKAIETLQKALADFPQQATEIQFYIKEIQAGRNP